MSYFNFHDFGSWCQKTKKQCILRKLTICGVLSIISKANEWCDDLQTLRSRADHNNNTATCCQIMMNYDFYVSVCLYKYRLVSYFFDVGWSLRSLHPNLIWFYLKKNMMVLFIRCLDWPWLMVLMMMRLLKKRVWRQELLKSGETRDPRDTLLTKPLQCGGQDSVLGREGGRERERERERESEWEERDRRERDTLSSWTENIWLHERQQLAH